MLKEHIIESETKSAPSFEDQVELKDLSILLEKALSERLDNPECKKTEERILNTLDKKQIITLPANDGTDHRIWIMEPFSVHTYTKKRPFLYRVLQLLKQPGIWLSELETIQEMDIKAFRISPFEVDRPTNETLFEVKTERPPIEHTLANLHQFVKERLAKGEQQSGVFEKPNGVVNRNIASRWLNINHSRLDQEILSNVNTLSLKDVVEQAKYTNTITLGVF